MQNNSQNYVYAGFMVRAAAFIIDNIVLSIIIGIFYGFKVFLNLFGLSNIFDAQIIFNFTFWHVLMYFFTAAYFIAFTFYKGKTLGKMIMKIKVISDNEDENDHEKKLTLFNTIYRETIGRYLSSLLCGIGYIVVIFQKQKKGFHDMLCDTLVIYDVQTVKHDDVKDEKTKEIFEAINTEAPQPANIE